MIARLKGTAILLPQKGGGGYDFFLKQYFDPKFDENLFSGQADDKKKIMNAIPLIP